MTQPLTISRFAELLAAYGAEPARWPASERAAAETLLAQSGQAQALLAEERRLDAVLDGFDAPPLPAGLHARILRGAPQHERPLWARFFEELGGWRLLAPGLAAALALGMGVGAWLPPVPPAATSSEAVAYDVLSLAGFDGIDPEALPTYTENSQ